MDNIEQNRLEKVVDLYDCLNFGGAWINTNQNFDNTINAMQLLFTTSSVDWVQKMYQATDAVGIGYQPIDNNNLLWIPYFVFFVIVFTFFLLNLFVGVVVSTFNTEKERLGHNFLLTETQKEWLNMKLMLLKTKPVIIKLVNSSSWFRKKVFALINHKFFDTFIFIIILCNTIVLSLNWYKIPANVTKTVDDLNYAFTAIFTIEVILKLIALRSAYFRDHWNKFDLFIVSISIVSIILDLTTNVSVGGKATIIRAFRVARLFRIFKKAKVLKIVTDTLIVTLPHLMNVGGLLLLILYIYAILGMQLFSGIQLGEGLNMNSNFQSFGTAFLTLIKISTGEEWDKIMSDMIQQETIIVQCDNNFTQEKYAVTGLINGCGSQFAVPYLFSFNILVSVIFLNLFVAIVLQSFEEMNKKENQLLCDAHMDNLRQCWSVFDAEGTYWIQISDFVPFLILLGEPLGFNDMEKTDKRKQNEFLKHIELPTYNKMTNFYYYDVIQTLAQFAYLKIESERKLKQQLMKETHNFEKLTIEILDSIKKELEFQSEVFRAKEIDVFKQAVEQEQMLYKKMEGLKDDIDSKHLWAGGRIKNMYKATNMNFTGGLMKQSFSKKSLFADKSKGGLSQVKESQSDSENEKSEEKSQAELTKKSVQTKLDQRRGSRWRKFSILIDQSALEDDDKEDEPQTKKSIQTHSNRPVNRRRSSILMPMIAPIRFEDKLKSLDKQTSKDSIIESKDISAGEELDDTALISNVEDHKSQKKSHFQQPKQKAFHLNKQIVANTNNIHNNNINSSSGTQLPNILSPHSQQNQGQTPQSSSRDRESSTNIHIINNNNSNNNHNNQSNTPQFQTLQSLIAWHQNQEQIQKAKVEAIKLAKLQNKHNRNQRNSYKNKWISSGKNKSADDSNQDNSVSDVSKSSCSQSSNSKSNSNMNKSRMSSQILNVYDTNRIITMDNELDSQIKLEKFASSNALNYQILERQELEEVKEEKDNDINIEEIEQQKLKETDMHQQNFQEIVNTYKELHKGQEQSILNIENLQEQEEDPQNRLNSIQELEQEMKEILDNENSNIKNQEGENIIIDF